MRLLLLGCALLPLWARAVDVPGWERDPIPGAEPGTEAALLQVYEDVLSPALLQALADEAPHLASFAKTFGNLKNSKYTWTCIRCNINDISSNDLVFTLKVPV